MQAIIRKLSSRRGQALMEFAFVAPIILVFLVTVVDFGLAIDRRITLQHAVREGARVAAVTSDMTAIENATVAQAQNLITASDVTVCYEDVDGNGNPGDAGDNVRVAVDFTYEFTIFGSEIFGAVGVSLPAGISMTPSADARLENGVTSAPACGP